MKPSHAAMVFCIALSGCNADSGTSAPVVAPSASATTTTATTPTAAAAAAADNPAAAETASTPLSVGMPAPDFTVDAWLAGKPLTFHLAEARNTGPVVLYFFPAAFTPGCNIEARMFSEAIDRFRAKGATVIGVTAGNADQLQAFSSDNSTCSGKFAVAADPGAAVARRYGALLASKPGWSSRTSFVIARDGRIAAVHSDLDPSGHVEHMLEAVTALQP